MIKYTYDVGVSYASEDEEYVSRVIKLLKEVYCLKTFFAPSEQRKMIGEDLLIFLNKVYKSECRYVVIFISENYLIKEYPRQEASVIKLRQTTEDYRFIIPVVFGDSRLGWLSKDIDYISGDNCTESEVAYYISAKIKNSFCNIDNKTASPFEKRMSNCINVYGNGANIVYANNIDNSNIQNRVQNSIINKQSNN